MYKVHWALTRVLECTFQLGQHTVFLNKQFSTRRHLPQYKKHRTLLLETQWFTRQCTEGCKHCTKHGESPPGVCRPSTRGRQPAWQHSTFLHLTTPAQWGSRTLWCLGMYMFSPRYPSGKRHEREREQEEEPMGRVLQLTERVSTSRQQASFSFFFSRRNEFRHTSPRTSLVNCWDNSSGVCELNGGSFSISRCCK